MAYIFHNFFYQPIFNALIFFYNNLSFGDLGIAIILLTIFIRLVLFPLFYKSAKDQAIIQRLSPKIKEIQKTHKDDKEKQTRALMELYKEHQVNPLSGFLLIFIQLPVLIALYRVFLQNLTVDTMKDLYSFISAPASINHFFLGFIDLKTTNLIIVILAAVSQYYQGKLALPKNNNTNVKELSATESMARQMVYLGPVLTFVFLYFLKLPSAVGLYWLTTSLFSVIQQIIINKNISIKKELNEEIKKEEQNGRTN